MTITIADDDKRLESSPLTSSSLLLYWANLPSASYIVADNLHDFIFEFRKEIVDNLIFFDGQRMEIDFLQ